MLPTNIDEIRSEHIVSLVTGRVAERRVLEYKERLPEKSDGARKEFLADVCSFANASGGDILYGIRDERDAEGKPTGIPESIVDVSDDNISVVCTSLEAMVRDGVTPRIPGVQVRAVDIPRQGTVVLLRIGRSWMRPHMVTYKGTSRFYSRHSSGKYQLDVREIGQAFAEQRSLGEELRSWRADRLTRLLSEEDPVKLGGPSKLLLHFVPAAALSGQQVNGSWPIPDLVRNLLRPSTSGSDMSSRYNADGFLVYSQLGIGGCTSYVQMFRNGSLEYADGYILNAGRHYGAEREAEIPSVVFEQKLVQVFENALSALTNTGVQDPVYFSCTLVGVQGLRLTRPQKALNFLFAQHAFDRQIIQTPEVLVDRTESRPYRNSVLPIVNAIWQANGYEKTPFEGQPGDWDPFRQ